MVATVLTVYGIETLQHSQALRGKELIVATVLTVYGIETLQHLLQFSPSFHQSQQYLPFTVLKQLTSSSFVCCNNFFVATVLTVYGIETSRRRVR